jgi:hypothetical protein
MLLRQLAKRSTSPQYWQSDVRLAHCVLVHVAVVVAIIEFLPASGALAALQCLTLRRLLARLPERSLRRMRGKRNFLSFR